MAWPAEINAVDAAPSGNLGTTSPTHRASHDQYRTALIAVRDRIDLATTVSTTTGSGAVTFDCSTASVFDRTMSGNATITLSNPITAWTYTIVLRQNGTGGFTVTFSTTVKWMGQDPIWSGVASKISGTATLMYVASAWIGWWGGGEQ